MRDAADYGEESVSVRDVTAEATDYGVDERFAAAFYRLLGLDSVDPLYFAGKEAVYEVNVWDGEGPVSGHGRRYVIVTSDGEVWGDGPNPRGQAIDSWNPFESVEAAVDGTVQELVDDFFDGEPPYDVPGAEELLN